MRNAFDEASGVEAESLRILRPFIEQRAMNGQYVTTNKGRLAKELQKTCGDLFMNASDGRIYALEIKAEADNKYGNFYLEIWSNLSRYTTGWMFHLNCDTLLYHFIASDELYVINFQRLRNWAFREKNGNRKGFIWGFPLCEQKKYSQLNDTHGACVPIRVIERAVGFQKFAPLAMQKSEAA